MVLGSASNSEELGSMPAQANWVRFRLLLIAIGLQSLSMKICMLQSPLCPRETGSPGRLSGDWLLIFFLDGLGSIPALLNSFCLFPVVEKDFLFPVPLLSAHNGKSY